MYIYILLRRNVYIFFPHTNPSVAGPKWADHWHANSTAGGRGKSTILPIESQDLIGSKFYSQICGPFQGATILSHHVMHAYVLQDFLLVNLLTRRTDRGFRTWALKKSMDVPCSLGYRRLKTVKDQWSVIKHESVGCVTVIVVVTVVCCACVCCGCCGYIKNNQTRCKPWVLFTFRLRIFPKMRSLPNECRLQEPELGDSWHCFPQLFCNIENERNFETCFFGITKY